MLGYVVEWMEHVRIQIIIWCWLLNRLKFYILKHSPIELITGKQAIVRHKLLSMFPTQFELIPHHTSAKCIECEKYGHLTQCYECNPIDAVTSNTGCLTEQSASQTLEDSSVARESTTPYISVPHDTPNSITDGIMSFKSQVLITQSSIYSAKLTSQA